jgi:hypothetical protein
MTFSAFELNTLIHAGHNRIADIPLMNPVGRHDCYEYNKEDE